MELVGSTETRLHESVEVLHIPSYKLVSRRDREKSNTNELNHGGIAFYLRNGGILVKHLEDSAIFERSWHIVHTEVGGVLLGLRYRPPGADARDNASLDDELARLSVDMTGALVVGDMNIWHKS